jgi:hypothetical protein
MKTGHLLCILFATVCCIIPSYGAAGVLAFIGGGVIIFGAILGNKHLNGRIFYKR